MTEQASIDLLREHCRMAQGKTLGEEMMAFSRLLSHHDATWEDLLQALARPSLIAEDAWLRLRAKLKDLGPADVLRLDQEFWRAVLGSRGISTSSKCNE